VHLDGIRKTVANRRTRFDHEERLFANSRIPIRYRHDVRIDFESFGQRSLFYTESRRPGLQRGVDCLYLCGKFFENLHPFMKF
jgi:hypothetical protein